RRMTNVDATSRESQTAQVFQVDLTTDFEGEGGNFVLRPYDLVVVRTSPGYEAQKTVRIEGEVLYPGIYTISKKDERITDVIERAGGFTPFAYIRGASLKRDGIAALRSQSSRNDSVEIAKQRED